MALTKRTYVDGETIITAQNLNDIQDEVRGNIRNVSYNSTSGKIQKTTNSGTSSDVLTVDATPTENSKNPVQSGGVYTQIKSYLFLGSGDDAPVIENGTNYNNITSIGVYRVLTKSNAGTMINTPNTNYTHRLIVMCLVNSSSIVQVFICNYGTNPAIFTRIKTTDGDWTPWRLLSPIRNSVITVTAGTGTQTFTWNICSPDLLVSNVYYSNPKAVGSDVTFTTGDGTISISGTFYEATDIHFDVQ